MACLEFVLDEIKTLGILNLEMEGWENYALHGSGVALCGIENTCFVVCEVWGDRDRKRRNSPLRDANGFRPPCDDALTSMAEHPNFKRIKNIVDQDRNLCLRFRGDDN